MINTYAIRCSLVGIVMILGCRSRGLRQGAPRLDTASSWHSSRLLTSEEIANARAATAYEAIARLRPEFIREGRDAYAPVKRAIYFDGVRLGDVEYLSTIPAEMIREVRFLTATDATARYGPGHLAGALVIKSKNSTVR